jgi:hypothetical protein
MRAAKQLGLIATGYALAFAGGLAAVALNELRISADIAQSSSGMVAFGDAILFLLVVGFLGLAPSFFLLKLGVEKAPRALLAGELAVAALGPVSWLAVTWLALSAGPRGGPPPGGQWLGAFLAFGAIPRMALGPPLLAIEAATFLMIRGRVARALLAAAMLMDLIPLSLFAAHMAGAARY